ncbi:MAG: ABC transporter substrate-binding protein [Deltaproteobacteria bacterium]|jgi:phospholipid transport system substrate-binding protein|nr:ABC transporter substrate-binding protein [Deltaproteobacteria bacterium]
MKKQLIVISIAFALLLTISFNLYAGVPTETVQGQVEKILTKLRNSEFKQKAREEKIAGIREIINEVFDWNELSRRTLGKNWKKFSPEQRKEFTHLFSRLLEGIYADRLLAYTDEKVVFEKETELKKGKVEVASHIRLADGKKIPLNYRMIEKDGKWRVYDVVIEGVSMVKNYRGQFRELLSKGSPADLIETLKKKTS